MVKKTKEGKKESDKEFLKRIADMQKKAAAASTAEMAALSNTKEMNELTKKFQEQGKQMTAKFKDFKECEKIKKEFETHPPILTSIHINGILVRQYYENKAHEKKVEMLRKNQSSFQKAIHYISTIGVTFKVFGKAYVLRGSQKIPISDTNNQITTLLLKDRDILGAEKNSYIHCIRDGISNGDEHSTDMIIYPKSEMRLYIDEKTTHPAPAYMDPKKIPEVIKKNSKSSVTQQEIKKVELLSGIFYVDLLRRRKDVNNLLKLGSGYPGFYFKPFSSIYKGVIKDTLAKMEKENPGLDNLYKNRIKGLLNPQSEICEQISAVIELCKDGSVVVTRALNSVVHAALGKETKKLLKTIEKPIKITLTRNALYETDTSVHPDERVTAIAKIPMSLSAYIGALEIKEDFEKRAREKGNENTPEKARLMTDDASRMLKDAEEIGDKELIEMAKVQLKTTQKFVSGRMQEISAGEKGNMERMIRFCENQIRELRPLIENDFPSYTALVRSDSV